jgi:predicted transcriptional regulator
VHKHTASVKFDAPIKKVVMLVEKEGFSYLPVLDYDDRVVGVVTPSSMINLLEEY